MWRNLHCSYGICKYVHFGHLYFNKNRSTNKKIMIYTAAIFKHNIKVHSWKHTLFDVFVLETLGQTITKIQNHVVLTILRIADGTLNISHKVKHFIWCNTCETGERAHLDMFESSRPLAINSRNMKSSWY